jgi:hypothetical protein
MVKDVRLALEEMKSLGLSMEVAEAVGRLWEVIIRDEGAESDLHRRHQADRKGGRCDCRRGERRPRGEVGAGASLTAARACARLRGSRLASPAEW